MKIDYNYMSPDALKKTYLLCRARNNNAEADKIKTILRDRGIKVPGWDDGKTKISFTKVKE